jgi:hypothetical protein
MYRVVSCHQVGPRSQPQLNPLRWPSLAAFSSSIFCTRFLNSSYWHFSYECRSVCEEGNVVRPYVRFQPRRWTLPRTSMASTIPLSGTCSAESANVHSCLGRPVVVWHRTSPSGWQLHLRSAIVESRQANPGDEAYAQRKCHRTDRPRPSLTR